MPQIDVNGQRLCYEDRGSGTAVVLVHGFPLDGRVWQGVADRLVARGRVIVPDLRGFGRNAAQSAFTLRDLADDLAAMMEQLGIAPCPVAGLSMGGYVVMALAKAYPGIASRLILVDTKAAADTPEQKQKRDAMAALATAEGARAVADQMAPMMLASSATPQAVADLRQIMESQPPATLAAAALAMRDRDDFTDLLPTLDAPVNWVFGDADAISPPDAVAPLVARLNQGTLTRIPSAGHMAPFEQPQAVADAIAPFLT